MVGGRLCCLSSVFTFSAVLLLGFCLHDVEGSSCPRIIHKTVGDTVEFPSCLSTDGVTAASWKFRDKRVADKDQSEKEDIQFTGRVHLNPTNFSLTVRTLTLQDSGVFSFVSEANDEQRQTITITLQVHEPLTKPVLKVNSTWHASNQSCTHLLECSASDSNVTYNWTLGNQQRSGPRLQYIIKPQDEKTKVTCTIFKFDIKESVSETVECTNSTSDPTKPEAQSHVLYLGVAAGCFVFIFAVSIVICVCHHKKRRTGCDTNDLTVYADISDVAIQRTSSTMKPCSVYETIDNRVSTVTPGPQTVYDQIQFGHVRKAPVPPKL
ncbi:uncharacterized protein LOC121177517 isoform X2 [Toxotes jaculatrix]|uniref:uncharacterized protein LOC121177517 isoform X2 n=1 Tax=Toxotes jaculatrix TaxID=941984 RepID=UPI001B3AA52B|nr:uncharacterized protein LOC121177517 isoform X2 [Toxotes jaculatrix]